MREDDELISTSLAEYRVRLCIQSSWASDKKAGNTRLILFLAVFSG